MSSLSALTKRSAAQLLEASKKLEAFHDEVVQSEVSESLQMWAEKVEHGISEFKKILQECPNQNFASRVNGSALNEARLLVHIELKSGVSASDGGRFYLRVKKFPRNMPTKQVDRLQEVLGSKIRVMKKVNGEIYFQDSSTRANSWLPSSWSQEEIRKFLMEVCYKPEAEFLAKSAAEVEEHDQLNPVSDVIEPDSEFLSADLIQMIGSMAKLAIGLFNVVMATLLTLTVPQSCPDLTNPALPPHDCTFKENVTNLTSFETAAVTWNFLTMSLFVLMYWVQWKRESFFIEFLDTDDSESVEYIRDAVRPYPKIKAMMRRLNTALFTCSASCVLFSLVNLILSSIVVNKYYAGTRSVTVFITNFMLLITVMMTAARNSWIGLQTEEALSCVETVANYFNLVDPDVVKNPELVDGHICNSMAFLDCGGLLAPSSDQPSS